MWPHACCRGSLIDLQPSPLTKTIIQLILSDMIEWVVLGKSNQRGWACMAYL
jgi:hypothetical protein